MSQSHDQNNSGGNNKGGNQQKAASPGLSTTMPVSMQDLTNPDSLARVTTIASGVAVLCVGAYKVFPYVKRFLFPEPTNKPALALANATPDDIVKHITELQKLKPAAAKNQIHALLTICAPEQKQQLVDSLAKAGVTASGTPPWDTSPKA